MKIFVINVMKIILLLQILNLVLKLNINQWQLNMILFKLTIASIMVNQIMLM